MKRKMVLINLNVLQFHFKYLDSPIVFGGET